METLKETIKSLAEGQSALKNQRRTVRLVGERTLTPYQAWMAHLNNREELRLLYATQGLLKGKTLEEIKPHNKETTIPLSYFQKQLDTLVAKYEKSTVCDN